MSKGLLEICYDPCWDLLGNPDLPSAYPSTRMLACFVCSWKLHSANFLLPAHVQHISSRKKGAIGQKLKDPSFRHFYVIENGIPLPLFSSFDLFLAISIAISTAVPATCSWLAVSCRYNSSFLVALNALSDVKIQISHNWIPFWSWTLQRYEKQSFNLCGWRVQETGVLMTVVFPNCEGKINNINHNTDICRLQN